MKILKPTLRNRVTLTVLVYSSFVAITVGMLGYIINEKFEESIWRSTLEAELNSYLSYRELKPNSPAPSSGNLKIYLSKTTRKDDQQLPLFIRKLTPGLYDELYTDSHAYTALVKDVNDHRIFMVYDITHLEQQELQLAIFVIIGIVTVGSIIIFIGFWLGGKLSAPVRDLAVQVENLNPEARGESVNCHHHDMEIKTIVTAINTYINRLDGFVAREQEFINTASHELRTPVAVIAGAVDVVNSISNCPESVKRPILRISQATTDIQETISALLFLAKEDLNIKIEDEQATALDKLLHKIIENHEYLAKDKDISIILLDIEPTEVNAPTQLVNIIVSNIVRNAIEHTERGKIEIQLRSKILVVKNTLSSISSDEAAKNYQDRVRNENITHSTKGLGLNIIDRLCSHVKWKLTLEQRNGTTIAELDMNPKN